MTPLLVHLMATTLTILALFGMGTQISVRELRRSAREWRTLLVVCIGQWLLLPGIIWLYLRLQDSDPMLELAIAAVALAPAGLFACTALYLAGISISAAVLAVLLLEMLGAFLLLGLLNLVAEPELFGSMQLGEGLWRMSKTQFLLMILPLGAGLALRHAWPGIADRMAGPVKVLIWCAYAAIAAFAISLKAHFSYRVDTLGALPILLGMVLCAAIAGLIVYLISTRLLRLPGQESLMASLLIGVQGPVPAVVLTVVHRDAWLEMAAVAIDYALLLPAVTLFWLAVSRTRWGGALLPR